MSANTSFFHKKKKKKKKQKRIWKRWCYIITHIWTSKQCMTCHPKPEGTVEPKYLNNANTYVFICQCITATYRDTGQALPLLKQYTIV